MAADGGTVEINYRAKLDQLDKDMATARSKAVNAADAMGEEMTNKIGSRFSGLGAKISEQLTPARLAAGGAAIGGVGIALTKMGDDSKMATAQLTTSIENAGGSMSELEPRIDAVSNKMIKLGHDDEAAARAMATLATATQDPVKAIDSMGLVADIAAARHISLESAADKLAKAYSGNTKIFKEFGITLGANATAEEKAAAMTELTSRVQGQAAAQADNLSTKLKAARIGLENIAESVGSTVGPALAVLGPMIGGVGMIIQSGLVSSLASGVVAAVRFGGAMIGTGIMAAQAAIPVLIAWAPVIAIMAAIGVAVYLLITHWDTLKSATGAAWDWIKDHISMIVQAVFVVVTGGLGLVVLAVVHNWDTITSATSAAWDAIKGVIVMAMRVMLGAVTFGMSEITFAVVGHWDEIVAFVGSMPARILSALGDLGSLLYNAGRDLIMGMLNGIKSMAGALANAAKSVASGAVNAVKGFLGIGSPSKLFMGFGVNIGQGLAIGMERSVGMVAGAGDVLASAAGGYGSSLNMSSMGHSASGSSGGSSGGNSINVGPFYVRENDLPTEIPRRLRGALHLWDR